MTETKTYTIQRDCFLGEKGETVQLNDRQAANLLAGGYITLATKPAPKKGGK